jgi:hypothetical protein
MRGRWWCTLAIIAPLVWFFGRVIALREVLDFRDIAHYYRPLWKWTSQEWAAGRVPLWCDLDGLGMPVHADPTAAIFYPGQLIFALPVDMTTRVNLFVVGHLLLAAVLFYRAALGFGASRAGAAAGAVSYTYGGTVLFLYCNPIFLVGAAWLPLALLCVHWLCREPRWRYAIGLAIVLALMTLGGDPHTVYHVALVALPYAWMCSRAQQAEAKSSSVLQSRMVLLLGGLLLAFALSAIQLLPTMEWSVRGERALSEHPRSLWEIARGGSVVEGLFLDPPPHSHQERIYDFSIGPWRWLELGWPNIGGRMFPAHQRWMSSLPAEGRVWNPSLYIGLAPLLAALAGFSLWRSNDRVTRWLSWLVVLGVVGSLGVYGLGWVWEEVRVGWLHQDPAERPLFGAVGGLYWFMVVTLPGYVQFRYPAKLFLLATFGLSMLAARHWQRWLEPRAQPRYWLATTAIAFAGSLVAMLGARFYLSRLWELPADYPFGPFNSQGAVSDVLFSALQTSLLMALFVALRRYFGNQAWLPSFVVALTALDLCVAHGWMISASHPPSLDTKAIWPTANGPPRVYRGSIADFEIQRWSHMMSPERVAEVLAWQNASLGEKCFLSANVNVVDAQNTLEPADVAAVWDIFQKHGDVRSLHGEGVGPATAVGWRLITSGNPPTLLSVSLRLGGWSEVYCPEEVAFRDETVIRTPGEIVRRARAVYLDKRIAQDRRAVAVVEIKQGATPAWTKMQRFNTRVLDSELTLRRVNPQHVEIDTDLAERRLVVLADYYAPGWCAEAIGESGHREPLEILRTNRVLRGVFVPPGKQRIVMRYRPATLYWGAAISGLAWLAALAAWVKLRHRTSLTSSLPPP